MASVAELLPFRPVVVPLLIGVVGTALLFAACFAIPFVIVRSRLKRPAYA